jgi:competence protein ComEC
MKVFQFPLTKITLGFIFGILVFFYIKPNPTYVFSALIVCVLGLLVSYFANQKLLKQTKTFGVFAILVAVFIGMTSQIIHDDSYNKHVYFNQIEDFNGRHNLQVVLQERLKSTLKNERYIANVNSLDHNPSSGKILINIKGNSEFLPIGTQLQLTEKVLKHKKPNNPNQFDYGNYLKNQSVLAQVFVSANALKKSPNIQKNIWYYSDILRNKIISNLRINGFGKRDLPVISALILGQQQEISKDILQDYQFAGAIHILSVSGLHIGFILLFITFLLRPLPKDKVGNWIRLLAILVGLWGFAIIAGLSPSVVRSATMFSFVAIGMNLKRSTNVFHTLLVSIFIILLFKPSFLFDVGFQLSYLSLFFILWIQPLLSSIWIPKNKISRYFWDILTVSFAAQIGALPLSIYYFHQFPGLFFVTNIIILPFLSIIMGLGVFVMTFAALNWVPQIPLQILEWLVSSLNSIIKWVASFEEFILKDIPFNIMMLIGSYLVIIAFVFWFKKPSFNKLALALCSVVLFQGIYFGSRWKNQQEQELIIFNSNKNTIIAERNGDLVTVYSSKSIQKEIEKNSTLKTYLVAHFSEVGVIKTVPNLVYSNHSKILILDSLGVYPKQIHPDILLITQSPKINLERFLLAKKPKIIVADGSNYKSYVALWKATCEKEKIPFHATGEKGFYRLN